MNYIKNTLFFIVIISGLIFAKKTEYARVISSDIYSTIIEFSIDDFELIPVHTEQGNMHLVQFKNGASILKQGAPDIHKISRSIIIPDNKEMSIRVLSSEFVDYYVDENVINGYEYYYYDQLIEIIRLSYAHD